MDYAGNKNIVVEAFIAMTRKNTQLSQPDPLADPRLRGPGILELLRELITRTPRPLRCVQVEMTSRCSAKCVYCPHTTHATSWKSRHMQDSTFAALWSLLRAAERVHLQGWGEPLLHPRFFDYAALAAKAGCRISTTSCGVYMNTDIATQIVQSGMDIMAFSLAGTDSQSNDTARVGAPFDSVCDAVDTLQRVRKARFGVHLEIHLAYILLADRVEAVRGLPALMDALDVHETVISTLDYIALPEHAALAFAPHEREKIDTARCILQETAQIVRAQGRALHYALPGVAPLPECREHIQSTLYVDADGNIAPCIYVNVPNSVDTVGTVDAAPKPYVFGNALRHNALDIWRNKDFTAFRQAHANGTPAPPCVQCAKRFEEMG